MVIASEEAQQEVKAGIEAERYYDVADFIGSSKMSNWQKAALLARGPLQDASKAIQEYYKTAEAPGHSWVMRVDPCPGQEDSDIQLEIGLTKFPPLTFGDRPRNTLSEEDGTKLLDTIEEAMTQVEWHRQNGNQLKNKQLNSEQKRSQLKFDLTRVLQRLSSLNGVLVGDDDQFKPIHAYQAQGRTVHVPTGNIQICSGEHAQSIVGSAEISDDYLVSKKFILKSADYCYKLTEDELKSDVEDCQIVLETCMKETGARDILDCMLNHREYSCPDDVFLNFLIQDAVRDTFIKTKAEQPNPEISNGGKSEEDTEPIKIRSVGRAAPLV